MRRVISAFFYLHRINEVVSKMRDMFQKNRLVVQCNVVEQNQVLVKLPHVADMRYDRYTKLSAHHTHRNELTYPRNTCGVNLNEARTTCL